MGLFGSSHKTVVSSSCAPMFNPDKQVNQYSAAMLDYTSNSDIEHSEYMKRFFTSKRITRLKGFRKWWNQKGYNKIFGDVTAKIYTDASLNKDALSEVLVNIINPPKDSTFKVYDANLNNFSDDFRIKYIATQQGKEKLFHQGSESDYTISYPSQGRIRATFKDGTIVEGDLPSYTRETRCLELSYSYIYEKKKKSTVINDQGVEEVVKETIVKQEYGYFHYIENSGIPALDRFVKDNGIHAETSFLPVIPLRSWLNWYGGREAKAIADAIQHLDLIGKNDDKEDAYAKVRRAITEGMQGGSLGDIDFATLLLAVSINAQSQAELKYLYTFFLNVHQNSFMAGHGSEGQIKPLSRKRGFFSHWKQSIEYYKKNIYRSFTINCPSSNLYLTYSWVTSEYFEDNGQFKPGAKVGEYGVISGDFVYRWSTREIKRDDEGYPIRHCTEGSCTYEYVTVWHEMPYNLTLFCHQVAVNRYHFVIFSGLHLSNNVYRGHTCEDDAWNSVFDGSNKGTVTHEFLKDTEATPGERTSFTFTYLKSGANYATGFIVPLEENTLREIGVVRQMELSYTCQYIIFNTYKNVKRRWYQRGFFAGILSIAVSVISFGLGSIVIGTIFATLGAIFVTAKALDLTLKIFQIIFGKSLGTAIFNFLNKIFTTVVVVIIGAIPAIGWMIAANIMLIYTSAQVLRTGGTLGDALKQGFIAGAIAGASSFAGSYVSSAMKGTSVATAISNATGFSTSQVGFVAGVMTSSSINSFGTALRTGKSFGSALRAGLISGAISGITASIGIAAENAGILEATAHSLGKVSTSPSEIAEAFRTLDLKGTFATIFEGGIIENPNTYVNLLGMTQEARHMHKLANLENDYQEFNDNYGTALRTLDLVKTQVTSTATAEFICKLQSTAGRLLTQFPDVGNSMSPDSFISLTTSSGSDFCNSITQNPSTFALNKLMMEGYQPEILFYNQDFFTTFN